MSQESLFNKKVCIAGNPNCGKTTLFNQLTGSHQKVGNWSGVTVDKKTGAYSYKGQTTDVVDLPGFYSLSVFNDGAVDRSGRFWAGTMSDSDPHGSHGNLYRLDIDGSVHVMDTGFTISNGIGWSPDNKIMYFTDTMRSVIYAYDFDIATGMIENRRPFVTVPEGEGVPDGLTVDSEGFVWSAIALGYKINRYDPNGMVEREIRVPTAFVSSCTFGGPGLDELYITTGWEPLNDDEKLSQPFAGDLFRVSTGVMGLEEPKYLG